MQAPAILLIFKKRCGQVSVAGVGQKNDDVLSLVFGALCKLDRSPRGGAGGNSHENALALSDELARRKRILVGNGNDFVVNSGVEHLRNKARTDSLNLVGAGNAGGEHRGGRRLNGYDLDGGIPGLQIFQSVGTRLAVKADKRLKKK